MQKNLFKLFALTMTFLFLGNIINAQLWEEFLPKNKSKDKAYTLFDYQKAFKSYCDDYKMKHTSYFNEGEDAKFGIPGYSQFRRWEWYWEPRVNQKTGEFPDKSAWEVWQDYKKQSKAPVRSVGGTWTSRGAANLDAYDSGASQESGTGRLNCAHFDPADDNHFWVGAPAGGLWETTDGGANWTCLTDNNPVLGVSDIAIPPDYDVTTNPTIYIASGDRDAGDDPSIGVLKTTDGGATWNLTGLDFKDKSGAKIGRLIINPDDKNIMWAATSLGMYRSADQGANWTFVASGNFIDMELIPGSTGTGAGTLISTTYGWNPKAMRSTDGGLTWTDVWTNVSADEYRCDVAVSEADASIVYLITADANYNMALHAIYKSTDGGASFSSVYDGLTSNNLYAWNANNTENDGGQGWYDVGFAVSSTNANVVFVGGVNGFISTDGANSFTICSGWRSGLGCDVVHADHHNAYFRPSDNRLFDCNDGGIYYSDDVTSGGSSTWHPLIDGIVTGQIYAIGVAQTVDNEIVAGYQDNGTKLLDPSVSSTYWSIVKDGDGMWCAIDPTTVQTQWGSYAEMQIDRTTNEWGSSSSIRSGGSADWAGPIEADPRDANTIFIGTDEVERYVGTTRTVMSSGIGASYLKALDVYNDGTNLVLWTASLSGCWKSNTSGGSFTAVSGLPGDAVTDMAIDADNYNHVYVCFGGYDNYNVYETTDGGANWTDISAGLPAVPCGAIVINEQNTTKNEVYVGTDAGIYVRLGDAPWQLFTSGMPYVSITDLEMYYDSGTPANTKIYAATYGRGVWSSDCYDPPTLDAAISYVSVPASEYCQLGNITPTVELANIGTTTLTSATISYTIDGGTAVTQNWSGSLAQGETTNIVFSSIALTYGAHEFIATVTDPNGSTDSNVDNDSRTQNYSVWNNDAPYTQTFDAFTPAIGYDGTSVVLEECWSNDTGESSMDWSVNQGDTPSGSTGPSGDHTSGTGRYLYTEVSGISTATSVNLLSPTFDLSNYTNNEISFWYCMNGANCGSLQIDLYYGGSWNNAISAVWDGTTATSVSGDKGTAWLQVTADISAADGYNDVQIRIASTTGTAYDGDIAIDDFNITGVSACTQPTTQASGLTFSSVTNNSITASWTQGNGDAELVLVREGSAVNQDPTSGNIYAANATFASGDEIGTGNYVVYDGTAGTVDVTGLTAGTTYYFAVYTYNSADHCYNVTELAGNTTTLGPPTVTTTAVSAITGNSASSGGNVTSDNGSAVTARGVCWNTSGTPTTADNTTSDGTGTGTFTSSLTGLSAITTYYVRAYATNSYGTSYGNEEVFTTDCGVISSLPWTEDFENGGAMPSCWSQAYIASSDVDWLFAAGNGASNPGAAHGGSYNAYLKDNNDNVDQTDLITPTFDFSAYSDAEMSFWLYNEDWSGDQDELEIYYKTSASGTWTQIGSTYNTNIDSWTQYTITLPNLSSEYSIAFRGNALYGYGVCIDDINVDGTPAATAVNWTGAVDSDWQTTGNWDSGTIPTSTDDVVIPNVTNQPVIDDVTVAVCADLTIESGASVTIATNGVMTVSGNITNNAGNSGLVINSDASGTGSLIHNTASAVDATVNTYFASSGSQWHMVGAPISNASGMFPSTANLYSYDESVDDYWNSTSFESSANGWTAFANGTMTATQAYLYNFASAATFTYTGTLNPGNTASITANYTDNGTTVSGSATLDGNDYNLYDGWNLVSNPFTATINWDAPTITRSNVDDAVYFYDGANSVYATWISGAGTNGGTQYIPAGQGVFVKADLSSGSIIIPNTALVHNSQAYWKAPTETPADFIKLQIEGDGMTDESIIRFNDLATNEHDSKYDAYKLTSNSSNIFEAYTKNNSATEYSINTLSWSSSQEEVSFRLVNVPDNFIIRVTEFNFTDATVYLRDNSDGTMTELTLGTEINLSDIAEGSEDRFDIVFDKSPTTVYNISEAVQVYPNPSNGNFFISIDKVVGTYNVQVRNAIGQIVYSENFNSKRNEIKLQNKVSGVYFIQIKFDDNTVVNKKMIIK